MSVKTPTNNREEKKTTVFILSHEVIKDKMKVFVINKNDNPLMPCKPSKARKLLRDGKAHVVKRSPFTIQLAWNCEEHVQEVVVGIDKGAKATGIACVANSELLFSAEIKHRTDVNKKMETRAANRRNRRSRKWYRPARFNNRSSSKRSGRLPPSIKTNVEEVVRVVKKLPLPIARIVVEDVQIDIRRLSDPDVTGKAYQQSNRLDENLRIACLMRDNFTCTQCGKHNCRLEAHHIMFRSQGGADSIYNLTTLCKTCHKAVHAGRIRIIGQSSGFTGQMAQRTMQGKAHMYAELNKIAPVSLVYGYETAALRKAIGLEKTHDNDALCIATLTTGERISAHRNNFYLIHFRPRQTRRQYYDLARKGKGRVRYQVNRELGGFRKGDLVRIKGQWTQQIISIWSSGSLEFRKLKTGGVRTCTPKKCQLVERAPSIVYHRSA